MFFGAELKGVCVFVKERVRSKVKVEVSYVFWRMWVGWFGVVELGRGRIRLGDEVGLSLY